MRDEMNYNAVKRVISVRTRDVSSEAMMVVEKRKGSHKDDEAMRGETCALSGYFILTLFHRL